MASVLKLPEPKVVGANVVVRASMKDERSSRRCRGRQLHLEKWNDIPTHFQLSGVFAEMQHL